MPLQGMICQSGHKVDTRSHFSRLTATQIESLRADGRRRDYTDPAMRGLQLRVEPSGRKTWLYRFKRRGQEVRVTLGYYPTLSLAQARLAAQAQRALLDQDIDPRAARRARRHGPVLPASAVETKHSIEFLAQEFLERYVRTTRRRPEYVERALARDVLPEWTGRDARTITAREVVELLDKIVARGSNVMANRIANMLSQMFRFGIQRAIVANSPVQLLYRPGGREKPRRRVLSDDELRTFLLHVDACCGTRRLAHALRLLLLTGQRVGELSLANWSEFDLDAKTWTIPDAHTKGGRGHIVPLSDWAIEELHALKSLGRGSRYLFGVKDATAPIDPKQITRCVGRCQSRFRAVGIAQFTAHDLRRTCRTGLSRVGTDQMIAELVLNHRRRGMEYVYDQHEFLDEKRKALEGWALRLEGLLSAIAGSAARAA